MQLLLVVILEYPAHYVAIVGLANYLDNCSSHKFADATCTAYVIYCIAGYFHGDLIFAFFATNLSHESYSV